MSAGTVLGFYQDVWEFFFVMWSHLFSGVISDEVVECLVVYTFVKSAPNGPPCSRVTGFPRYALPPPILQYFAEAKMPLG
jgi:hypothetical protein